MYMYVSGDCLTSGLHLKNNWPKILSDKLGCSFLCDESGSLKSNECIVRELIHFLWNNVFIKRNTDDGIFIISLTTMYSTDFFPNWNDPYTPYYPFYNNIKTFGKNEKSKEEEQYYKIVNDYYCLTNSKRGMLNHMMKIITFLFGFFESLKMRSLICSSHKMFPNEKKYINFLNYLDKKSKFCFLCLEPIYPSISSIIIKTNLKTLDGYHPQEDAHVIWSNLMESYIRRRIII